MPLQVSRGFRLVIAFIAVVPYNVNIMFERFVAGQRNRFFCLIIAKLAMTPFCDSTMDGFFVARQSDVCPGLVLTQVTTVPIVPYLVRFFASQPMRFKFTIQSSLKRAASRAANVPFLTHIVLDGFVLQKNVL
jgi:hypothetical protein